MWISLIQLYFVSKVLRGASLQKHQQNIFALDDTSHDTSHNTFTRASWLTRENSKIGQNNILTYNFGMKTDFQTKIFPSQQSEKKLSLISENNYLETIMQP